MAKSLTVLNKDLANTLKLHSINQPHEAIELVKLSEDIDKILKRPNIGFFEVEKSLNDYYGKLMKFMTLMKTLKEQNIANPVQTKDNEESKPHEESSKITTSEEQHGDEGDIGATVAKRSKSDDDEDDEENTDLDDLVNKSLEHIKQVNKNFRIDPSTNSFHVNETENFEIKNLRRILLKLLEKDFDAKSAKGEQQRLFQILKTTLMQSNSTSSKKLMKRLPGLEEQIKNSPPRLMSSKPRITPIPAKKAKDAFYDVSSNFDDNDDDSSTHVGSGYVGKIHFRRWQKHQSMQKFICGEIFQIYLK